MVFLLRVQINTLVPEGADEEAEVLKGASRQQKRYLESEQSLLRKVPGETERELVHDLFLKTIDPRCVVIIYYC